MFSSKRKTASLVALGCAGAFFLAATPASAEMAWSRATSPHYDVRASDNGCPYGVYRAPNGNCDPISDPNRDCQVGLHAVPTPFENGYRCVQDGY